MKTTKTTFAEVPEGGTLSVTKTWVPSVKKGSRAILVSGDKLLSASYELLPTSTVYVPI